MNGLGLKLQSGTDIPFPQLGASIHQPTIKEISFIGEEEFFMGCELLTFSKTRLRLEEQQKLQNYTDFEVLISILNNKQISEDSLNAYLVLNLMFPNYNISFSKTSIELANEEDGVLQINNDNFQIFKDIVTSIFMLSHSQKEEYRAGNAKAQELIDKFKKSREKIAKDRGENKELDILGRYISILSVGLQKDMNSLTNYTVYQLTDEFERFVKKQKYDIYISAKMAGAKDMEEPDNWMDSIRQSKDKKDDLMTING